MAKVRTPNSQRKANLYSSRNDDSPSRQLQFELERAFSQIHIHENERQKVHAFNRRSIQESIDARELAQAIAHQTEIDASITKHEVVRQQAVAVLEAHIREEEEQRRRQEEEERLRREAEAKRRAEEQRRIQEERDRKAREEKEKADAAARVAEQKAKAKADAEERTRRDREATAEREKADREKAQAEAQARAKSDADAAAAVAAEKKKAEEDRLHASKPQIQQPGALATKSPTGSEQPWSRNPEIRHQQYLKIHRDLKAFRKDFWVMAKKDPVLKPIVGDMRRALKVSVGQLTEDKAGNRQPTQRIKGVLLQALKDIPSPPVTLNDYLPAHLGLLDKNTTKIPSLLLYLVSMLSKAVINAFTGECSVNTKSAEPIGTMVAQVFSSAELQFQRNAPSANSGIHYDAFGGTVPTPPMKPTTVSLISILICKFHAAAPILFGIYGPENTAAGKLRLGWRRELGNTNEKQFILEQKQYDRLIGLGAGYASIALRNFSKSSLNNPWPPINFWESLAHITNTDSGQVQISHLLLLKSMLENGVDRFVLFFGAVGVAALRQALVEWPKTFPSSIAQRPEAQSLTLLVDTLAKEKNFRLA